MMNIYQMRNSFSLKEHNTAITREDFEGSFTKTRESVRFTFNGWDGKSYDPSICTVGKGYLAAYWALSIF